MSDAATLCIPNIGPAGRALRMRFGTRALALATLGGFGIFQARGST